VLWVSGATEVRILRCRSAWDGIQACYMFGNCMFVVLPFFYFFFLHVLKYFSKDFSSNWVGKIFFNLVYKSDTCHFF
jgi:hypothetical protein